MDHEYKGSLGPGFLSAPFEKLVALARVVVASVTTSVPRSTEEANMVTSAVDGLPERAKWI